mgnify:CR=1 FL=1|jgi:hypothetical protein
MIFVDVSGGPAVSADLVAQEMHFATCFDGARVDASYGATEAAGLRPTGSTPETALVWTGHDRRTTPLVAAGRRKCYLHGTSAPNHDSWRGAFGLSAWSEVFRPPSAVWAQWIADHQAAIARDRAAYVAAGLDPQRYLFIHAGNESGKGGGGGCHTTDTATFSAPYAALPMGTWERAVDIGGSARNIHAMYEYMAANASKQGLTWIAPSLEASWGADFTQELATIGNGDWHGWFDAWSFHRYDGIGSVPLLSLHLPRWLDWRWDRLMAVYSGILAAVPSWAAKPCWLTETGLTLDQLGFGGALLPKDGFRRAGDYMRAWLERLVASGLFGGVSLYAARERTAAAAASRYGVLSQDGSAVSAAWASLAGLCGDPATSLPGGAAYELAPGESASLPEV